MTDRDTTGLVGERERARDRDRGLGRDMEKGEEGYENRGGGGLQLGRGGIEMLENEIKAKFQQNICAHACLMCTHS